MLVALGDGGGVGAWTVAAPDGRGFAVVRRRGDATLRVVDAACPYSTGPLVDGRVDDDDVVSPWHWYRFSLTTGVRRTTDRHRLGVHRVVDVAGEPHADVGEAPRARSRSER